MTQNNNHSAFVEEVTLGSDLWGAEKYMPPTRAREEQRAWGKSVAILRDLCSLAVTLHLEQLELALSDALGRATEELERASDHAERLSVDADSPLPRERERLTAMMRRSDALRAARDLMEEAGGSAEEVAILEAMSQEVGQAFDRYKAEVGIDS